MEQESRPWHHRPAHVFVPDTMYIVMAGTMRKEHFFEEPERRRLLQKALFEVVEAYGWRLEAWENASMACAVHKAAVQRIR